ncbi:hypothetical protein E5K00_09715 [Hymenobacter aquaticus]|uniref:YcxB family protein n=1 Tax=Hymenobacter aquaticus TaxID=1867101 RepID=A0A4Z0Q8E1_9BACT|nr:YcxB family protein [Hymenobacter aquaticus]TGE25443.1 hypothetical protein E5K00_09715 [Hymenobacter aquaticus]
MPTAALSRSAPVQVAPTAVSFAEYQAIHQEQQRRRHPAQETPKPETADPWKMKVQRWAAVVAAGAAGSFWLQPKKLVGWLVLATVGTALGLLHQWWEYRRAYRQGPAQQASTSFAAEARGIYVEQAGKRRFYRWQEFYSIQPVGHWLLLYTSVEHCYYLDLNRIEQPATADELRALLPAAATAAE